MSFFRWSSPMGHIALAGAAALFAVTTANAQFGSSPSAALASNESSSNDYALLAAGAEGAQPATPEPAAAGGGQYDNTSSHGSMFSRLTYEAGGGFNAPTSDSGHDITWGGNFTLGAGMRFSHGVSLLAEYQFIDDKLPGRVIAEAGATGGNAHIWSLTLDPVIDLMPKRANSVYITGGGGFYRKVTNFTDPVPQTYCTYFYCGVGYVNGVVGHFSSNQGGWSIGGGFTHKIGGLYGTGKTQIFAEARYLDILTPAVTTSPNGLGVTSVSADTKIIPVTVGVRF